MVSTVTKSLEIRDITRTCTLLLNIGPAPAITRLGIKPYQWGTECLSGDVSAGPATSFPQSIGMVWHNIL